MRPTPRQARLWMLSLITALALWAHGQAPAGPLRWLDAMTRTWVDTSADITDRCQGDDEAWTP